MYFVLFPDKHSKLLELEIRQRIGMKRDGKAKQKEGLE